MTSNSYKDLQNLQQRKSDIFIMVEPMHTWLTRSEDGDDYFRPYLVMVVDVTSLLILKLDIVVETPGLFDMLDLLASTFLDIANDKSIMNLAGFKPQTVIVESAALAEDLKEHLEPLGIGVVCGKRPRQISMLLREVKQSMQSQMDDDFDGMVESTGISLKQARAFYKAANTFFSRSPWSLIEDSAILWITLPDLKKSFYVSVKGQGEVQYGLSLYTKPEQVQYYLGNSDVEHWKYPRSGLHMLLYSEPPQYSTYDLDYICGHHISIPSPHHLPCPFLYHARTVTYPDRGMILWYEAVLKALPDFIEAHFPLQGTGMPDLVEERITVQTSQGPYEVHIRFPSVDMAQIFQEINQAATDSAGGMVSPVEQQILDIISTKEEITDDQRKAQDLIYDAWEQVDPALQAGFARQALVLWPDCADAYNTLAGSVTSNDQKLAYYEKALEAGRRALGEDFLADPRNVGHFWGILETRPYMRALAGVGQTCIFLRQLPRAEDVIRNMLYLNPGDNQGGRYLLLTILMEEKRYSEALQFISRWDDISPDFVYTRALLRFEQRGDLKYAHTALQKAFEFNPYVPGYLCLRKRIHANDSGTIMVGGADEAEDYVQRYFKFWRKVPGALTWLEMNAIEYAIIDPMRFP